MTKIREKTVLITGGASGIGYLMAGKMLEKQAALVILWDIDREKLIQSAKALPGKVATYTVDVSDTRSVKQTAHEVIAKHGAPDILINNAGIVVGKAFKEHQHHEIDKTMDINSSALMHITLEFIHALIGKKSAHIVNISSAASYVANPNMSVYVASKWAATGWSESLRLEMERQHPHVHVTTVIPYYIDTGMFAGIKTNRLLPMLKPEKVAGKIIAAIEKDRIYVKMPFMIKLTPFVKGILPARMFDWFAGKVLGIYDTMTTFKGRRES